ncbi:MAG: low specificity L-threonine aldolase [Granulosicoccus sp.]
MHNFYSDTQTRPSRAMRESMLDAEVGDERHDDCPTTKALNTRIAELFGMEAAVFLPSGTMCNEIAIAVHCLPGDEVICARESHVIFAESGGPAALSGVMMNPIDGLRGMMTADEVAAALRPDSSFAPRSRLVITEQTANLAGGAVWPVEQLNEVALLAQHAGLAVHLDGARILNAVMATGVSAADYAKYHDSAWIAFTKGLGCPVGAVLAGSQEFINRAWLFKRRWGGAMRQTGVLAAMCLYALDHHVERLKDDHAMAKAIGDRIAGLPMVRYIDPVQTNIVMLKLAEHMPDARACATALKESGIQVTPVGRDRIRIVTHMDVEETAVDELVAAMSKLSA